MIKKVVIVLWFFVFLSGCSPSALNFKIQYQRVNGLKPEQSVVYENQSIGSITGIELSKEGHYLVAVLIEPEHVDKITVDSEFFISKDPDKPDQQAIEVVSSASDSTEQAPAETLREGVIVKGMEVTTKTDVFVDELKQGLTEGLGGLMRQLEVFTDQLEKLPESEEFKQFEKELEHFGEEMGKAGKEIQKKMDEEYIPQLQKGLDKLEKGFSTPPEEQKNKSTGVDA